MVMMIMSAGYNISTAKGAGARYKKTAAGRTCGSILPKRAGGLAIGSPLTDEELGQTFSLQLGRGVQQLSENLIFWGKYPDRGNGNSQSGIGEVFAGGCWQPDFVWDDSALVYKGAQGLVIITGCSHAGICNIIEYAKKVSGDDRVQDVIGGFHLLQAPAAQSWQ